MAAWIDRAAILGTHDKRWRYSRRSAGLGPRGPFCSGAAPGPRPPPLGSCAIPVPPRSCARPCCGLGRCSRVAALGTAPLFRARSPAAALLGRTGTQPLLRPDALFGRPWTTALLRPTALRLRARGTSTLLGSAAFPALGFCGLSALLGTRRRGRALRGAGLFATDLAALRFWCFAAPFGRRAGLTFRAAALPLFGHPRLFALLGRARLAGLLRLLRGARRTQSRRLLGSARSSGARRLLRPAGRTRSARRFTPRFGRCSGLAFLPNRAGPGTRLTRLLRLAGGSRRILAEPALLAGSERRRQRYIPGGLNRRLLFSRLSFRGRSGVRSCEPRSHSGRRPSRPVPAGGPRRGARTADCRRDEGRL